MKAERELAKFLDRYFYTDRMFSKVKRNDDEVAQMEGSDIVVSIPDLEIQDAIVDEKAAIYYINKDLKTFVLELSFIDCSLQHRQGWFVNPDLTTEYYLMQWIKADVADPVMVNEQDVTEIECVLVSRRKLFDYFRDYGYDVERLNEISRKIRRDKSYRAPRAERFRFLCSGSLAEKPVNVLLDKDVYIRLSELHCLVRPDSGCSRL